MKRLFRLAADHDAEEKSITIDLAGDMARAEIEGRALSLELLPKSDGSFVALFEDGRVLRSRVLPGKKEARIRTRGREVSLHLFDPRDEGSVSSGPVSASEVAAAMPGRVLELCVREGDRVAKGDLLLILEAMKMQNEIRAEADQVVAAVTCVPGQVVEAGTILMRFEAI
jgi:biotin carboxyl carrier protein